MVLPSASNGRGNKGLKIEEYSVDKEYSITINPQNQPEDEKKIFVWLREWHDWFAKYNDRIELRIYLECSGTGRYHWHGTIKIINIPLFTFFLKELNKYTHFEIDTITCVCVESKSSKNKNALTRHGDKCGRLVWDKYIHKQSDIWYTFFTKFPCYYPIDIDKKTQYIREPVTIIKLDEQPKGLDRFGYEELT